MKILLLNDAYFRLSLQTLGHNVFFAGPASDADLKTGDEPVKVSSLLEACPFKPDIVLLSDSLNFRSAFLGLEDLEIPAIFYGIDSPMNTFWQFDYARVFDLAFFDQKEPVDRLRSQQPEFADRIHWLPLGADHRMYTRQECEKVFDVAFVGTLHPILRPKRSRLLGLLQRHFQVAVFDGGGTRCLPPAQVVEIYNRSKLVLNENLFPGINLRLLEAMCCGACVLTEESDGSWQSCFHDGDHLVAFNSRNVVQRIENLLRQHERRQHIADTGMTLVHSCHTIDHRAKTLLRAAFKMVRRFKGREDHSRRIFHLGKAWLALASRWRDQPVGKLASEAVQKLCEEASHGFENPELHYELGARALREGRLPDAAGSLRRALQLNPSHLRSIWGLFWCLQESGDHRGAATEIYRMCRQLQFKTSRRFLEKLRAGAELEADDYLLLGKILEKAGWLFETGIDRLTGHPSRWNAYDAWQKAIQLDASQSEACRKCADIMEKGPAPEFAIFFLEKLVDTQPLDSDLRFRLAVRLLEAYSRDEGLKHILQYLFTSAEAQWWDRVESLKLSESEWTFLLDAVLDYSRQSESLTSNGFIRDMQLKANLYRDDPSEMIVSNDSV
jgi:tetratricopeptide (TPR) repeat protein